MWWFFEGWSQELDEKRSKHQLSNLSPRPHKLLSSNTQRPDNMKYGGYGGEKTSAKKKDDIHSLTRRQPLVSVLQ